MGILSRLEQYTEKRRQEVLLVKAEVEGEPDQIAIFRGFSSSLMRSTNYDPDVSVLPDHAVICRIDRLLGPYDPQNPHYLQRDLSWETVQPLLSEVSV